MLQWRWDQGRLEYFQIEKLRKIASVMLELDGAEEGNDDILRDPLTEATNLPFSPINYKVWRNYARVIKLSLIATRYNKTFHSTDIAKSLVYGEMNTDSDLYFITLAKRFFIPSPIFAHQLDKNTAVYPMLAIIKLLICRDFSRDGLSPNQVLSYLARNNVTGLEPQEYYTSLRESTAHSSPEERRQVSEMMKVMSQISFLFWNGGAIYIDPYLTEPQKKLLFESLTPERTPLNIADIDDDESVIFLGSIQEQAHSVYTPYITEDEMELQGEVAPVFAEGRKKLVNHLKIERNNNLRKYFLSQAEHPDTCDMCQESQTERYPWAHNIIEVHHKLPLSSTLHLTGDGTTMGDLVGLCPSCHKAVHRYYRQYLLEAGKGDFESREEAFDAYQRAVDLFSGQEAR
ncbi:TPA: HNH endonuclease [Aeromonas dhakensis]|uniref:HNH endonuclease n=1 Tax=Aeromonas dhakensis TaxID=196024 RepID=UPI0028900E0E|nr:HNH endonuclease [Aeromonas dhakensis]